MEQVIYGILAMCVRALIYIGVISGFILLINVFDKKFIYHRAPNTILSIAIKALQAIIIVSILAIGALIVCAMLYY